MNQAHLTLAAGLAALASCLPNLKAEVVFETTSPYHHVLVVDEDGRRTLSFDGSLETRMSLRDPLQGHFQYTEFFHLAWLWNTNLNRVLMIGLGGGSTQRSFLHDYPNLVIDSVEIDPVVVHVATNYFGVPVNPRHRIFVADGRAQLRRSTTTYDLILLDAYVKHRYGSEIPAHLVTREFIELARDHLTPDGVLAYNVIGSTRGWKADVVGALARTLSAVFPRAYYVPASESQNVVLIASRSPEALTARDFRVRASQLVRQQTVSLPRFIQHAGALQPIPDLSNRSIPILTDDRAPVERLAR